MIAHDTLEALFADGAQSAVDPLWTNMHAIVPPVPRPKGVAHVWRYGAIRPLLDRAGRLVSAEDAERRVFMLTNPTLKAPYTTDTLYAGLQLILPGEVARAHRHTSFALRFIVEGEGAYTAVGGEKVLMGRGDLVLTPSFEFHDHGNESDRPMVWLDGLDIPLFHFFPANFAEPWTQPRFPSEPAPADSRLRFPWAQMQARLDDAGGTVELPYEDKRAGGPIARTTAASALRLQPGVPTATVRETSSAIYHVVRGSGRTRVGDQVLEWKERDTFCVPSWQPYAHETDGGEAAYLFRYDDAPAFRALGMYRRDAA
ncbi:MAG TPA: cupin domain-containing protein [Candidatus Sulfotelmatobacter sp.]|nr:cupin domain-containing protein [Candidatus Sulfotelmatobacter sp.]